MTTAREIRQQLNHPVVDADGHWVESAAVLADYVRQVAGTKLRDQYVKGAALDPALDLRWYQADDQERIRQRYRRVSWWHFPSKTEDFASFHLPRLLHQRLPDMGIDFAIIYPSTGLSIEGIRDPELRGAVVRAYNVMAMEMFSPYADRMTPVAVIPRRTPAEAIAEMRYAVTELGFKTVMVSGTVHRRSARNERYVDALGLDNEENYDPLWQTAVDLKVAITSHAGALTWSDHASVTNYCFNHIGHFAEANATFAKALFLGGVVRRFPNLNFGLLEGGTGWARNLLCDLRGHYDKRSWPNMNKFIKPTNIDLKQLRTYIDQYGTPRMQALREQIIEGIDGWERGTHIDQVTRETEHYDDFAEAGITNKRQIADEFTKNFYFGCEADDPMTATAFDTRLGKPLKAIFSSDIGHWDVPDVMDVMHEVYEMFEKGLLTAEDFRQFTFANAVHLHGGMNPDYFKGTAVEAEARAELASKAAVTA